MADDSHIKNACSYTAVFNVQAILYFWVPKTALIHLIIQIKQAWKFPNFRFPKISSKANSEFRKLSESTCDVIF